jgi:hypothetical protein
MADHDNKSAMPASSAANGTPSADSSVVTPENPATVTVDAIAPPSPSAPTGVSIVVPGNGDVAGEELSPASMSSPAFSPPGIAKSVDEADAGSGKTGESSAAAAPSGDAPGGRRGRRGKEKLPSVPFKTLFRYSTGTDRFFYVVAGELVRRKACRLVDGLATLTALAHKAVINTVLFTVVLQLLRLLFKASSSLASPSCSVNC